MATTDCPYVRYLKPGSSGREVGAYQRCLARWNPDVRPYFESPGGPGGVGFFGKPMASQLIEFKRSWNANHAGHPFAPLLLIPDIGPHTHYALTTVGAKDGSGKAADTLACRMLHDEWLKLHPQKTARDLVVTAMQAALLDAGRMIYSGPGSSFIPLRWSGISQHIVPPEAPPNADCSSLASWALWTAHLAMPAAVSDPSENDWSWGTTLSMEPHGKVLTIGQCQPGDCIFYGHSPSATTHVTVVTEIVGGVPYTIGFGSQGGPRYLHYRYRPDVVAARSYVRD